jgi:multidrug efflux system outer membrane protein
MSPSGERARWCTALTTATLWCSLASSTALAEPAAPATAAGAMTEDALVTSALTHNADLRAGRWERNVAEAQVTTATALQNPVLRLEWLHAQNGDPLDTGGGARLSWTPPQPWEWSARRLQARAHTVEVEEELNERAADLELSVRSACATVDALAEQLALSTRAVETRRSIHSVIKERLERGASTRIELNAAALAVFRAEQERDAVAISRRSALLQVSALAGLPRGTAMDLAAAEQLTGPPRADEQELERALLRRPLLRADAARAEQAAQAVRAEKTRSYPWISLSSLPRLRITDASNRPYDLTFSVDITLPILDTNSGRIAAAEAEQRRQEELRSAHLTSVHRDVDIARGETIRRGELVERYRTAMQPIIEEHALLLRDALMGRQLDFLALLAAEETVVRAQREEIEARLAHRKATILLARASGAMSTRNRSPR